MKTSIYKIALWITAISMIIFGLNKFLGFIPIQPPKNPIAQQFLGTMFTSYLYIIVAISEILAGILLIIPKTRFIGWLLLTPIILNMVIFHIAHDFIGNGIWLFPLLFFSILSYGFKDKIISLIKV